MNRLDRVISWLSPEWGARRALARAALSTGERLVGYSGANPGRLDRSPTVRGSAADFNLETGFDRRRLVDKARDLEMNNLLADSLLTRTVEAVMGERGFTLRPQTEDKTWNREARELWDDWCENDADARGIDDFAGMMRTAFRQTLRDGDGADVMLASGSLRNVESDEIGSPKGGHYTPSDVDGVELDRTGRPVAYQVFDYDPDLLWADRRIAVTVRSSRIPADDTIFLANRQRGGQTRGVPVFNGAFWLFDQIDGTLEATTVATRMAACFGLVITRQNPFSNLGLTTDSQGNARNSQVVEPGMIFRAMPGDEVKQVQPAHVGTAYEAHLRLLVRLCAIRLGLPLELALLDFSQSNYSNARAVLLQAQKTWRAWQHRIKRVHRRIYHWKVITWIEEGRLRPRRDALRHKWETPGWQWLDPVAEIQGAMAEVDGGFNSRSAICARMGQDFEEVVEARALELELLEEAGVPDLRGTLSRDPAPIKLPTLPAGTSNRSSRASAL